MGAQLEDIAIGQVERELAHLRAESSEGSDAPDLRMSTMTHIAWVPEQWYERAISTLHGMGERHPSRTILLSRRGATAVGLKIDASALRSRMFLTPSSTR